MIPSDDLHRPGSPVVLVIDGDHHGHDAFAAGLVSEGFRVLLARTGQEGLSVLSNNRPDAVVVSSELPDLSSHAMLRLLHEMEVAPVIAMSSSDDEDEAVLAFEMGAVDFLSRLGRVRETAARIWSALRSLPAAELTTAQRGMSGAGNRTVVAAGPVEVDLRRREVRIRGALVHARPKEIDLLGLLVSEKGAVVTRENASEVLWPKSAPKMAKTLDVHIRRLRYLVEEDHSHPRHIITVRGYGHRFDP